MKIIYILVYTAFILSAEAGDKITNDEFRRLPTESDRLRAIENAPPERRDELNAINVHLTLLSIYSEESLRDKKKALVTAQRGFPMVEDLFDLEVSYLENYAAGVISANKKSGMNEEEQEQIISDFSGRIAKLIERNVLSVREIAFHLAPTPSALKLEQRIESLVEALDKKYDAIVSALQRPITKEELLEVDRQVDEIFDELNKLPKLSPDEVQRQYDSYPEKEVLRHSRY